MNIRTLRFFPTSLGLALVGALVSTCCAAAAEPQDEGRPVATPTKAAAALGEQIASSALSSDSLDGLYGTGAADATSVAVSDQMLQANDTGNAVIAAGAINSGTLTLSGGAFGNFNGVGNFVFNTGNNNTLQGSINITVLTPPK